MILDSIRKIVTGNHLPEAEMQTVMLEMIDGTASRAQVASFVTALRMKGETVAEITGATRALRSKITALRLNNHLVNLDRDDINVEDETILATGNTAEDGTNIFNVATATTFVVAGGGVKVVRHGNWVKSRYVSAAEVLQSLGVKLDISRTDVEKCIESVGIGFLFAPRFHGVMRYVDNIRAEIGIRTIFNLISPMANPAGASAHVLGVYEPSLTETMARVLNNLGAKEAFIVYGEDTLDEISIYGPTRISRLKDGQITSFYLEPEECGLKRAGREAMRGGDARQNSRIIREIFSGEASPQRDMVLLNSAAAFVAARLDPDLKAGVDRAAAVIDSGKAAEKLEALVNFTSSCSYFCRE